jgi:hypothetical protein
MARAQEFRGRIHDSSHGRTHLASNSSATALCTLCLGKQRASIFRRNLGGLDAFRQSAVCSARALYGTKVCFLHKRAHSGRAHIQSYSVFAVCVTLTFHPIVSLMPSHHPASLPIEKRKIKSLAEHQSAVLVIYDAGRLRSLYAEASSRVKVRHSIGIPRNVNSEFIFPLHKRVK